MASASSGAADFVARRDLWPIAAAAERLSMSTKTLYRERNRGRITLVRVGTRTYVTNKELERYLNALEGEAS